MAARLWNQLFFQVGVDAIGNLPGRLGDGLHHPLEVNVLVLQLVDHIVKAGRNRGVPCGLRAGGGAGSAETNVGVGGVEGAVVAGCGLDVFRLENDVFPAPVCRVDDLAISVILILI